ncbi:NACHT domain-containing protein [Acinetobacter guillouiae]|uniref:NACHT domain-containing protein n=2 Tax=Acinetobacter TaxID=469 RepID=UPI003AF6F4A6
MTQSSELAGGDGFTFEGHVGGLYLSALLAKRKAVGCDGIVINVATQQRDFHEPLDDIVVRWKDKSDRTGTTSLQVKRKLTISDAKKNKDFRDIVKDSWITFSDAKFIRGLDKFGAVVGYMAESKLRAFRLLCESAKESNNPSHFEIRFTASGNASKEQREIKKIIENIITEENKKILTDEEIQMFLSHFTIIQFDALHSGESGSNIAELNIREFLGQNSCENEKLVLAHLITNFRTSAGKSGQYDHERLLNELKKVICIGTDKLVGTKSKLIEDSLNYIQTKFSKIPVLGIRTPISLNSCWIPLKATIVESESYNSTNLKVALKDYHDFHSLKKRDQTLVDAFTFGRFVKQAVIIGGPGIGKSTLLKKLALDYSIEGKFVIFVKLSTLQTYLDDKRLNFEECLLRCGFENSINTTYDNTIFEDSIILGDGLDECGIHQTKITNAFHIFSHKYKSSRILLTSRPIGYISGLLGDWRHYQLQPIDEKNIHDAVTTIIKALPHSDVQVLDTKVNVVLQQINSKYVKGIASRSPLILTLMSVLASQTTEIATNRASLYRQFFNLIQKNATEREIGDFLDSNTRIDFLYTLGFILFSKDSPLFDEISDELVNILKLRLGGSILEIKKIIHECIIYWEKMGVIEKVQTLTETTLTFIHKTLCEFTFAKYIESSNYDTQQELFSHFYNDSNFIEVISFLSHLGLSNRILEILRHLSISDKKLQLSQYLEEIINSSVDWNSENVNEFIDLCWNETNNTFSTHRYNAGSALCLASSHCWEKMSAKIEIHHESGDDWIKLVTWACFLSHMEYPISNEGLLESLDFYKSNFPQRNQLNNRFSIVFNDPINRVRDIFIIHLTKRIVLQHQEYPETKDVLVSYLLEALGHLSYKLGHKLRSIFKEFGLVLNAKETSPLTNNEYILNHLNKFNECDENFFSVFLFNSDPVELNLDEDKESFLEMGAFFRLIGLHEAGISSFLVFDEPVTSSQDIRVILFEALASLGRLDYKVLQSQAKKKSLKANIDGIYSSIFLDIPDVDIIIDYSESNLTIDILPVIKKAISSGNEILAYIAINIALAFVQTEEFNNMVCDLIYFGEADDLFYSSKLGKYLSHEKFQINLFEKLTSSQLTYGCRNLFRYLDPYFNRNLYWDSIYNGLASANPEVAKAAVESIPSEFLDKAVVKKLRQFYKEWKEKEEPYPKNGGKVPTTPREKLAEIIVAYDLEDVTLLQQMAFDSRPDIRSLSCQHLIVLARNDSILRKWIITEVCGGGLDKSFLKTAIQGKIYLNDYEIVLPLLFHEDSKIRYAAVSILKYESIPRDIIRQQAELLLKDSVIEMREIAHNILKN